MNNDEDQGEAQSSASIPRSGLSKTESMTLAERIADALFTTGQGEKGANLHICTDTASSGRARYLAGWSKPAVIDQINSIIGEETK